MQKIYHIINYIMLLLLIGSLSGFGIRSYQLGVTRRQLDYIGAEFELAQSRQQEAFDTIDECYRDVERTGEILNQSINTIQDIRRQLQEIRESYEALESRLYRFYDGNSSIDISTNSTVGE